jgi:hypothetical protein
MIESRTQSALTSQNSHRDLLIRVQQQLAHRHSSQSPRAAHYECILLQGQSWSKVECSARFRNKIISSLSLLEKSTQRAGAKKADKQIDNRGMLFNIAQSLELEQLGLFISFSSPLAGLFTVLVPP